MAIVKIKENVKIGVITQAEKTYILPDRINYGGDDYIYNNETGLYENVNHYTCVFLPAPEYFNIVPNHTITPETVIGIEKACARQQEEQQAKEQTEREQKIRAEYEEELKNLRKAYDDLWKEFCPF